MILLTGKKIHLTGKECFSLSNFFSLSIIFFPVNNFFPCQVLNFFPCQFLMKSSKITTINSYPYSVRGKRDMINHVSKISNFKFQNFKKITYGYLNLTQKWLNQDWPCFKKRSEHFLLKKNEIIGNEHLFKLTAYRLESGIRSKVDGPGGLNWTV